MCLVKKKKKKKGLKPLVQRFCAGLMPNHSSVSGWEEDMPAEESGGKKELVRKDERQCGVPRTECDMLGRPKQYDPQQCTKIIMGWRSNHTEL